VGDAEANAEPDGVWHPVPVVDAEPEGLLRADEDSLTDALTDADADSLEDALADMALDCDVIGVIDSFAEAVSGPEPVTVAVSVTVKLIAVGLGDRVIELEV